MMKEEWTMLRKLMLLRGATGGGGLTEYSATGNPATFNTNISKPLKSLLIPWTPSQSGSGDPSPENPREIQGVSSLTVWRTGKNIFDVDTVGLTSSKYVDYVDGTLSGWGSSWNASGYVPVAGNANYVLSCKCTGLSNAGIAFYDAGKVFISGQKTNSATGVFTFTTPANARFLRFTCVDVSTNPPHIEVGSTPSEYTPYVGSTIHVTFPDEVGTVYGGSLDLTTGVMTVSTICYNGKWGDGRSATVLGSNERKVFDIYDGSLKSENQQTNKLCNIAKWNWSYNSDTTHYYVSTVNSKGIGYLFLPVETDSDTVVQICADLATEQTIQLTPQQITALIGDNVIWSDTNGENTAVYLKRG